MRSLNIGGIEPKDGFEILNIMDGPNVDHVGDIRDLSKFDDHSFDIIYASHVLEHVPVSEIVDTLKGVHRVLQPDGKFLCSVPDIGRLAAILADDTTTTQTRYDALRIIFGGQVDAHDYHYFGYTHDVLWGHAHLAGFQKIVRVDDFGLFNDTSREQFMGQAVSLNVVLLP